MFPTFSEKAATAGALSHRRHHSSRFRGAKHRPDPTLVRRGRQGQSRGARRDLFARIRRPRATAEGTHAGEFMGIPPTGKSVSMTGIAIYRIANGKIVEKWGEQDRLRMLQQLGASS